MIFLKRSWISAAIVFVSFQASGQSLFVSQTGSDNHNSCRGITSPCKTIQHAVDMSSPVGHAVIKLSPGIYNHGADITHYRFINIDGDCKHRHAVTINVQDGDAAFTVEDHAVLGVQCMIITGGSTALSSRQFSVLDYVAITFGPMSVHVSASEASKINCGGAIEILSGAIYHIAISGMSQVSANCDITIPNAVSFSSFAWVVRKSLFDASGLTLRGAGVETTTGQQYIADGLSLVVQPTVGVIPGHGFTLGHGAVVE